MPLEPLHHGGIDALQISAPEPVPRAFDAQERRGHGRPRQRRVLRRFGLRQRHNREGLSDPPGPKAGEIRGRKVRHDRPDATGFLSRTSATIADMGYLGLLPCLTANAVNPFAFNNGER